MRIEANAFGITSSLYLRVQVTDKNGVEQYDTPKTFTIPAGLTTTAIGQASAIAQIVGVGSNETEKVSVFFDSTTTSTGYLVGGWAGGGAKMFVSAYSGTPADGTLCEGCISPISYSGTENGVVAANADSSLTVSGFNISHQSLKFGSKFISWSRI